MERFGKFQLLERIGVGGMAEIYLARPSDVALSKLVAVKRILPKYSNDNEFIDMFRSEGEIALRLRHPSIIMVYELGTANNQYYMSMEFFPGKTLAQLMLNLRNHNLVLDISDKFFIIKSIADALQYIHDFTDYGDTTEIIHRDISPQNILVGFDGAVKLIDFGVAKIIDKTEETRTALLKGKMAYMSPEQIRGEKLTKQTDIFSLGVVLWEVLAGRKLFTGATFEEVARKVEACEIPSLMSYDSSIPLKADAICQKALAKNTKNRYQSARELVTDLDQLLKSFRNDGNQRRVAKALQNLFSDDFSRLQEQLKKHEGEKRPIVPASVPASVPAAAPEEILRPAIHQILTPPQAIKRNPKKAAEPPRQQTPKRTKQSSGQSSNSTSWLANGIVFLLGVICVVFVTVQFQKKIGLFAGEKTASVVLDAQEIQHESYPKQDPAPQPEANPSYANGPSAQPPSLGYPTNPQGTLKPKPVASLPSMSPYQPQAQLPHPTSKDLRPPKKSPTAPKTSSISQIRANKAASKQVQKQDQRQTQPPVQKQAQNQLQDQSQRHSQSKTTQSKKVATKTTGSSTNQNAAKNTAKNTDRKPAAQPPLKSFAYLTVFAEPDAQIMIDGKVVGTEIVNDQKVPADKKITVKIISPSGKGAKVQQLQLKPFSRNVVDMAQGAGASD